MHQYFTGSWMKENILLNHGPLCSLYKAHKDGAKEGFEDGDFRSEGDSPAFIHTIQTGLRSMQSPEWGGWGGRYVWVRENTWLDHVPVKGYKYPEGRWYGSSTWGRNTTRKGATSSNNEQYKEYFKPMWRWSDALQNDFAARADWSVKSFEEANHPPVVRLANALDINAKPGGKIQLSAKGTTDPDDDEISYLWWQYYEADTHKGSIQIEDSQNQKASLIIPDDVNSGETVHIICEVTDNGTPKLTRYQRVIISIK